jgi:hypothetical protein
MDNDSLSAVDKLKQLKTAKSAQPGLDPNIFFTQLPRKTEVVELSTSDDELFGSSTTAGQEVLDNSTGITEDDLFGGETINIVPSSTVEKIIETREGKIADIEKAIAATKIEIQGETKTDAVTTEERPHTVVNGVKKYTIKEEDKPAAKLAKATKAIRKASHNNKELDDVDLLEKVLISLMLNNIKK